MKKHPIQIKKIHSGKRGWTKKLIETHGEQTVYDYWYVHGNRKSAEYFGVSPWTISHCVRKYWWTRPMENAPHILWGVARGKKPPSAYPHLTFEVPKTMRMSPHQDEIQRHAYYLLKKDTFIGWCMLNSGFTYCNDIYLWMRGDKKMDWVETYEDQIKAMQDDRSGYFEPRHYNKVKTVYTYYKNRDSGFTFDED